MFFLLRMAFWLGLVLVLLPTGSSQPAVPGNEIHASEAISAASATVGDLRQFCTRQPDACTVGTHVATELGYKAQAGAKMLYDVLSEALASKNAAKDPGTNTPKTTGALATGAGSQNTLTPADLVPAWHSAATRRHAA